jgi:protein involved in polysaccharide export with SLBB domain
MLNLMDMCPYKFRTDFGDGKLRSTIDRKGWRRDEIRQIGLLILMGSFSIVAFSQSINPGPAQNPSAQDCSDPLLASAPSCAGQNQGEFNLGSTPQMRSTPSAANSSYSDTEQLSRPSNVRNPVQQMALPAEPPTEFQNFINSTTGLLLPIYGANLFSAVPSTFAPLDMAPVPPDYVIGPDDELRVRVWGQVNFQANVRVDRSGDIFLSQVGPVHVAGLPFSELDSHLRNAIGRVYHNFDLTADIGQIRAIQVYVSGEARRAGLYTVSSLSTLVDALFFSGGPSVQGSMRHIQLRRGNAMVTDFDLYNLLIRGDKSKDVKLQSGDVIFIPPVGPQAAVTGSIRNSAIYELVAGESLADLIANAGGASSVAAEARVSIERIEDHHERHAMEVAYDATGLATLLVDGDLVHIYAIVPKYGKTVILRGNIANPGRFAWHAGMHVSDLIPDIDSLVTRNYWWKRARLGLPGPEEVDIPSQPGIQGSQSQNQSQNLNQSQGQNQSQNQEQNQSQSLSQNQNKSLNLSAQQRAGSASLANAQAVADANRVSAPGQRTEIKELAPAIDWDYAVIERLNHDNLSTEEIPFDLGKLVMQHDASQDLELQPGDVVSIFSQADFKVPIEHQTKQIKLGGEVAHAGVYTARPGESLRQLVERAGGLMPNAYLFGSEFTRESTRAVQQARINEYVQSLGMQIERSNLALVGSAVSSPQDLASGAAAQAGGQNLVASLRQIRATGRIVLRFGAENKGLDFIPNLELEDGDAFTVPAVPATINVVGAVYDQNSFLYARGARVGTFLRYAGGPTRDGDRAHEFVIRANGEVISRDRTNGMWSNDFEKLRLYPGDSIVVPEKTFRSSTLRGVIDWSTLFSQFALGAAALSVLK